MSSAREASQPRSANSISEKDTGSSASSERLPNRKTPLGATDRARNAHRRRICIVAAILVGLIILALALGLGLGLGLKHDKNELSDAPTNHAQNHNGPNVLVIMTDDQDMVLNSLSVQPNVKKLIGEQGVTYSKHYCTVAWCCPSRVNFLTGRAAHNTNVTSTVPPYGGWPKFTEQKLNDNYLPVWINDAGINTYYVGKFMNGYGKKNYMTPHAPKGWTNHSMLVDPWTYNYYHSAWTEGSEIVRDPYKGVHTTDVTQSKALAMLDVAASAENRFFMMVAPVAPHQELAGGLHPPPVPKRYRHTFSDRKAPRGLNWNPAERSGASWVYNLDQLDDKGIQVADATFNHRLGNLAAIDDMVAALIQRLEYHGMLENTYIVYTSDNGFHIGNHRLPSGKRCPYEEDINIPLLIRGPDVPKNQNSSIVNSHTDMAPTILQMLNVTLRNDFDGAPIAHTEDKLANPNKNELVNVEFWNGAAHNPIGVEASAYYNNTYKALRLMSDDNSLFYSTWCTGEREFYDMKNDTAQMHNRLGPHATGTGFEYYGRPESELFNRLDAVLMVTKSCKQDTCRNPWQVLFPTGPVTNLKSAMDQTYDSFFLNQPKISFSDCAEGHIVSEEGPMKVNVFGSGHS